MTARKRFCGALKSAGAGNSAASASARAFAAAIVSFAAVTEVPADEHDEGSCVESGVPVLASLLSGQDPVFAVSLEALPSLAPVVPVLSSSSSSSSSLL